MIIGQVHYKLYEWSKKANALSIIGAILKGISIVCIFSIIALLLGIPSATNPDYQDILKKAIPVLIISGIILFILGISLSKKADKIALYDLEEKAKTDLNFARKMAHKYPENKEWYMSLNSEYEQLVNLGNYEDLDYNEKPKMTPARFILTVILAFLFVFGGFYLLGAF